MEPPVVLNPRRLTIGIPVPCTESELPNTSTHVCDSLPLSVLATSSGCLDREKVNVGYLGGNTAVASPARLSSDNESPAKIGHTPGTPLTPTANLKMLVAAASALDCDKAAASLTKTEQDDLFSNGSQSSGRKMKSLSLLCDRFLLVAEGEIGAGKEFSLEMMANSLGTNRRRIYDIINVMEALEMISKQSKNWYKWLGRGSLLTTLARLKNVAADDPDIRPYLEQDQRVNDPEVNKENCANNLLLQNDFYPSIKQDHDQMSKQTESFHYAPPEVSHQQQQEVDEQDFIFCDSEYPTRSVRFDKSLGVLCQKFVMLFLVTPESEVTLEEAGRILVPDSFEDTVFASLNPPVNPKTKVRRLYDIANILTSLGLIKKKTFVGPHHMKKPGYAWAGPALAEIDTIAVARKNELAKGSIPGRRSTIRKPALNNTPRQCMQGYDSPAGQSGSAPTSPAKSKDGSSFRRSLSFGSGNSAGKQPCVLARPLCPKQVDYLREMREFEAEIHRHSHRYPHVASVFHEFLQKYQGTLEQAAAANGRFILPKSVSPSTTPPPGNSTHSSFSLSPSPTSAAGQTPPTTNPPPSLSNWVMPGPVTLQPQATLNHSLLPDTAINTPPPFIPVDLAAVRQSFCPDHTSAAPNSTSFHGHLPLAQVPVMPMVQNQPLTPYPNMGNKVTVPLAHHQLSLNTAMNPADAAFHNSCSRSVHNPPAQNSAVVTNLANSILANVFNTLQSKTALDMSVAPPLPPPHSTPHSHLTSNVPLSSTSSSCLMNQGTLISPAKAGANAAFMRVEDFLVPLSSKLPLQEAIAAAEMTNSALIKPNMSGIGFLSSTNAAANFARSPSVASSTASSAIQLPGFGSLVSQKPIPSSQKPIPTAATKSQQANPLRLTTASSQGAINPGSFLSGHSFPQEATCHLPAIVPARHVEVSTTTTRSSGLVTDPQISSPPKRPRLE